MTNYLGIATVTAALCRRVQVAIEVVDDGALGDVIALNPSKLEPPHAPANVFLYQAIPNTNAGCLDLPTRSSEGGSDSRLMTQPRVGLDLHYVITFMEDEQLKAQRLMGRVLIDLNTRPWLAPAEIREVVATDSFELKESNLADQTEPVRLQHLPLTPEELQRFWSLFPQVAYRLSLFLSASVVILEDDLEFELPKKPRLLKTVTPPQSPNGVLSLGNDNATAAPSQEKP